MSIETMSKVIDEDETYTYEILEEKDCIECATFLAHSFTKYNPFEIYMKTTYEQFYTDALSLCKTILNTNLSIIARHKQTHEIHGIVQGVDAKTFTGDHESTNTIDNESDKPIDPTMEMMHQSEQEYLKEYENKYGSLKENCLVHILMAGVRSDSTEHGLGTKLHRIFLDNSRRRGFKHVIVDGSSSIINHIYTKKFNGQIFKSIHVSTWITKNSQGDDYRPFEYLNNQMTFIVFDL